MMIPIARKEQYINEIVGKGKTAPGTPQTREEFFYAAILGEVVAPFPITNIEKYLAKIAGKYNGELPEPITRIEFFIARAAGMNVSAPTPITREEMFWADYAAVAEYAMHGIPPLTFNAVAGSLKNYRIYGQSSKNLFDGVIEQGSITKKDGTTVESEYRVRTKEYIQLPPGIYTLSANNNSLYCCVFSYNAINNTYDKRISPSDSGEVLPYSFLLDTEQKIKFVLAKTDFATQNVILCSPADIEWCMLNSGSTALPYGESVGDRTGNLFDERYVGLSAMTYYFHINVGDGTFTLSTNAPKNSANTTNLYLIAGAVSTGASYVNNGVSFNAPRTVTSSNGYVTVAYRISGGINPSDYHAMLNSGSTALPYEPYGYKVPVTVEGKNLLNINNFISSVTHGSGIIKDNTLYLTATESDVHINSVAAAGSVYDIINGLKIPCKAGKSYILTIDPIFNECYITFYNNNNISLGYYFCQNVAITAPLNAVYMTLRLGVSNSESGETYSTKIMIAESISSIPYEPYRTPITTNIYLPEQIKMVGDEAEYIDYREQKQYFADGTSADVTLPALPTVTGTNVLSVGTEVQPSDVYIKYEGAR